MFERKLIPIISFLVVFSTLAGASTFEDELSRISGKVGSSASGGGVPQATIILFENGAVKFSTRTDRNGNFSFINIPPGQYLISAKKNGYNDFNKNIKLNPRFTLKIKFDLVSKDQPVAAPVVQVVKQDLPANPQMKIVKNETPDKSASTKPEPEKVPEQVKLTPEATPAATEDDAVVMETEASVDDVPDFVANPEQQPEPEGGIIAIYKNIKYPDMAIKRQIQGTVLVNVTVDQNGNAIRCDIAKSVDTILDEAAVETIYNSKFIPASHQGKKVTSTVAIPVKFRLKN